jgi:hypothetical protein
MICTSASRQHGVYIEFLPSNVSPEQCAQAGRCAFIKEDTYIYGMPVKRTIAKTYGTYFITFTCFKWLSLIERVKG